MSDRHKHPDYSETYVRDLRDQRDDWRRIAQTLGYNEAGAEWLEPWCDEHPDLDGQGCVACIGASHDAWMHRAKAAEAEVARLREAVAAAKAVAWCVADPYDDASDVIVERESWAQLRRALAALEAGER